MDSRIGEYPHDEWFNGDVTKQIEAGTYQKFRPTFVSWVAAGKITADTLAQYDMEYQDFPPVDKPVVKKVKKAVGRPKGKKK